MSQSTDRRKLTSFEKFQIVTGLVSILLIPGIGLLLSIESKLIDMQAQIVAAVVSIKTHEAQQTSRSETLRHMHLSAAPEIKCIAMHGK